MHKDSTMTIEWKRVLVVEVFQLKSKENWEKMVREESKMTLKLLM